MNNRFSNHVKEIISLSREEASRMGNDFIAPEHLLLAMTKEKKDNIFLLISPDLNIDLAALQEKLESILKETGRPDGSRMPNRLALTKEAEKIIRDAKAEADEPGGRSVEAIHLLLGILKQPETSAGAILKDAGLRYATIKEKWRSDKTHTQGRLMDTVRLSRPGKNAFWKIFLFEIKYRLKRPDTYLYFVGIFLFSFFPFSHGYVPANEKTFVNSPLTIAKFFTACSVFMMVISAALMGTPLYRDIEFNTHEYYLSYPITKNDYFWGRFLGSFLFVILIGSTLIWGSLLGTWLGPKLGWLSQNRVGPYHLINYLQPFLVFVLPNLLFTSSIFFGLVAYTRNIKVIYSGGVILYLAYMTTLFIFHNLNNLTVVYLFDPFAFNPITVIDYYSTPEQRNNNVISIHGLMLANRIAWTSIGLAIVFITYLRFSFTRFFSGRSHRKDEDTATFRTPGFLKKIPAVVTGFKNAYNRRTIYTLSKIELVSIIRDNYFRIIVGTGILFLGFIFWMGSGQHFGVQDFPRTVVYMTLHTQNFLFFIFLILLFYTGETVNREKATRFSVINDALPPADWVLYSSKLIALSVLAFMLATLPLFIGMIVQIAKGYHQFNFPIYLAACYGITLPLFIEMIMLAFVVHVLISNKFAAHALALAIWTVLTIVSSIRGYNYKLFLYGFTPEYTFSDMDGISTSVQPLFWFNVYWLSLGGLFLVVAAVFYFRGVITSARERIRLARHRFHGKIRPVALVLLLVFLACGSFNYYNVSYVNSWPTRKESIEHMVLFEKSLKQYESDPLPAIVRLSLYTDIFPAERRMSTRAYATLLNKTNQPITRLLLDGDRLSSYSIKYNGKQIPYSNPLIYSRGKFSLFGPKADTSMYRLYQFPGPLAPGDTALVEINSSIENKGFTNNFSGAGILHHVTASDGGLPEVGYDADEEYDNNHERKEYHLPIKKEEIIPQDDSAGLSHLYFSNLPGALLQFDATISTSDDQTIVAPGRLEKKWTQQGRNYFHFVLNEPTYPPFPFFSAKYAEYLDSLTLFNGKQVKIECYYQPGNAVNLQRFVKGCKEGLDYFSRVYGPYPFDQLRLVESSIFTYNYGSYPALVAFSENYAWNASFNHAGLFDYPYFFSSLTLAQQWWMYQVAPNHTIGSNTISQGLAKYSAFILYEKKTGIENMTGFLKGESDWYLLLHHYFYESEKPLLFAKQDWVWDTKAGTVLFGLKDLIGEDSLNKALREFHNAYALRDHAPFAGSNDLYRYLKKHVPDSMQYYLSDTWERITVYDNKILEAKLIPQAKKGEYIVHVKLDIRKTYMDSTGNEQPVRNMHDFIDLGIFGQESTSTKSLYFKRHRFSSGIQELDILVTGKPISVGIDPYFKLIDIKSDDNSRNF